MIGRWRDAWGTASSATSERVRAAARRFDRLSLRERAVVAVALLAGVLLLWDSLFMQPLYRRERAAREQLDLVAPEGTDIETALTDLEQMVEQEKQLQLQYYRKRARLESQAASLIDPANMPALLRNLIAASDGVQLKRLANLPVEEIKAATSATEGAADEASAVAATPADASADAEAELIEVVPAVAYLHGIEIVVSGDYASIQAFVERIEQQRWRLLWRRLELDAQDYPLISARIAVASMSLEKHWLSL